MKELYKKALEAHNQMLLIHIDTKTSDADFHEETEGFYETLFEVAHKIGEKYVDLGNPLSDMSLEEKKKRANKIISQLKNDIETYHKNNEVSLGTEDLLGSLANDLENIEGTSKAFL